MLSSSVNLVEARRPASISSLVDINPRETRRPRPIDSADQYTAPVLAIYGEADEGIPPDAIKQFDDALDAVGIEHETLTYPNAPHSFFDRQQEAFADASADAWANVKAFIANHTASA